MRIEREIAALFPAGATIDSIAEMPLDARHLLPDARAQIDYLMLRLHVLAEKCREQSVSVLVPMGAEIYYWYQETLITGLLRALRLSRNGCHRRNIVVAGWMILKRAHIVAGLCSANECRESPL
jgi:hypothetical protein